MNRREFIGGAAALAVTGCVGDRMALRRPAADGLIKCLYMQLGQHMWRGPMDTFGGKVRGFAELGVGDQGFAQAGVRYSITNPDAYIQSNLIGFYNILEACRHHPVMHLVYASSSSVYGGNKKVPFSTDDRVDNPVSLYAATKKSNELMAHCYSKLYNIPSTGLRFFTVYGPAGRPDMAYFGFTNKLLKGETIQIYNYGNCRRDFTYVDDIVEGIVRVMAGAPERRTGDDGLPVPPYAVYNIGGGQPENLLDFVQTLQEELLRAGVLPHDYDFEAHKQLVPMQPGDVPTTYADAAALERDFGFTPKITLREGLRHFAEWYKEYYG